MIHSGAEVVVCSDGNEVAREAMTRLVEIAAESVELRGSFSLAVPGGSSPRLLFDLLAQDASGAVPWAQTNLFFTDERCVPPDHGDSNYRLARETLVCRVPIPPSNVHRFRAELAPEEAAAAYESEMRMTMGEDPRLDLAVLGMGDDTHTASLFPHSPALGERSRLAVANWVERLGAYRLTLTVPALNRSRHIIVLATGQSKAQALALALAGDIDVEEHPIQAIRPVDGSMVWIVDQEAAALL